MVLTTSTFTGTIPVQHIPPPPAASATQFTLPDPLSYEFQVIEYVENAKVVKVEQSKNGKSQKVYLEAVLTDMTGKTIYSEAKALFLAPNNLKYVAYLAPIFKVLGIDSTHLIAMGK